MANIPPIPLMSPIADSRGIVTLGWASYFRDLLARVGGTSGTGTSELASQAEALQKQITALQSNVNDFGQGRAL